MVEDLRESPLRHQTRKVSCSPDGRFFAVGSTEVIKGALLDSMVMGQISYDNY